MKYLSIKDIIILGLLNLALFVGAGNIIFPPYIGYMSGANLLVAAIGFLLTGVGLPVLAAIAMGPVGGSMQAITNPLGRKLGLAVIIICYLCTGPMGATPRAATIAYELAFKPFFNIGHPVIFFLCYFAIIVSFALQPHKIFNLVGQILTPIKVIALLILCLSVFTFSCDTSSNIAQGPYLTAPFSEGISQGYLTMDAFASMIFGIIMVNAVRSRGVTNHSSITRYVAYAALIAGVCLSAIYFCLFLVGSKSTWLVHGDITNGTQIINPYVYYHCGIYGKLLMSLLITIACIIAAIGISSSGSFLFSRLLGIPYKYMVFIINTVAFSLSTLGLTRLIAMSVPVLLVVYPAFIILIVMSFFRKYIKNIQLLLYPSCMVGFVCGFFDAFNSQGLSNWVPHFYTKLPFFKQGLAWITPCVTLIVIGLVFEVIFYKRKSELSSI